MYNAKHKSIFFVLALGLVCSVAPALFPIPVSAEDSFAMSINSVGEYMDDLRAGESTSREFAVINKGNDPFDIEISVAAYYGGNGTVIDDESAVDVHTQIHRWIKIDSPTRATLKPGEAYPIKYTITVPNDPPSGGQNAVINIASSSKDGGGVGLGKALGHTVHANVVDGNTRTEAELAVHDVPSFMFAGPINSTVRIDNTGNTDVPAKFKFSVYNFFSEDMVYTYEIGRFISFPQSKVTKNLNWDGTPLLGIFKVDSVVEMLGETYVEQKTVIVIPVFIIILFIMVIALLIVLAVNRSKAKKAKIVNKNIES